MSDADKKNRSIRFKATITLEQFEEALKHFDEMYKILSGGKGADYTQFTDWLEQQDFVELGITQAHIDAILNGSLET